MFTRENSSLPFFSPAYCIPPGSPRLCLAWPGHRGTLNRVSRVRSLLVEMDFSSTHAALRSLKRRPTTSDALKSLAEKLDGPFAGELVCDSCLAVQPWLRSSLVAYTLQQQCLSTLLERRRISEQSAPPGANTDYCCVLAVFRFDIRGRQGLGRRHSRCRERRAGTAWHRRVGGGVRWLPPCQGAVSLSCRYLENRMAQAFQANEQLLVFWWHVMLSYLVCGKIIAVVLAL